MVCNSTTFTKKTTPQIFILAFWIFFWNIHRYNKLVCLAIFPSRNQPGSIDMLQNELVNVQRWMQESWHIKKKISFWQCLTTKSVYFCFEKLVLDVPRFIKFDIEESQSLKLHVKLLLSLVIEYEFNFKSRKISINTALSLAY